MNNPADHVPVLVQEVVQLLVRAEGGTYLDGTVGLGGHAEAILGAAGPGGRLLGVDLDPQSVARAEGRLARFRAQAHLCTGDFVDLGRLAQARGWVPADGVLLDLGLSTWLIEGSGRGFSFQREEPLDMRFDITQKRRACDILNQESSESLTRILGDYGEEPLASRLARAIATWRARSPLESTAHLRAVVIENVRGGRVEKTLARVFQAIRIAVNDELGKLRQALPGLVEILRPGGRLAVIAYHSLEDRVAKRTFRRLSGECVCPPGLPVCACGCEQKLRLVTRAVRPTASEVGRNPRARSAILRVVERVREADPVPGNESAGGRP